MTARSVVVTGASRGLGLASAIHLYRSGWSVVGAMRSPEAGLERIRKATGAAPGDPRLTGVALDLEDPASIAAAAKAIEDAVGPPDALVHNAGQAAVGCAEELPPEAFERLFATNLFGPARLTAALLPGMRAAGRGRIVVVSSQGGIRGMPAISAYSGSKAALERWAESLAQEIAPFGLGVSVLVAGAFATDILTDRTPHYGDARGPYAGHYEGIERRGRFLVGSLASPPERFAAVLAKALEERGPFARRAAGGDARLLMLGSRFLSGRLLHRAIRVALALPRPGALSAAARRS